MLKEVFITNTNCITPLGFDVATNIADIELGNAGVQLHADMNFSDKEFFGSIIDSQLINEAFSQISTRTHFTKLEKMLILALHPLVTKKPTSRTALVLSSTKGNISALQQMNGTVPEGAYLQHLAQTMADFFGFSTTPIVISNACVSGILAVATAKRLIQGGMFDNAYVIAGDEFSKFVFSGFTAFQALSAQPCKPYSADRDGLNLGESAAAIYLTSDKSAIQDGSMKVIGDSAINDANHISGPSRTGEGLYRSICNALLEAKVSADNINYISAHGTATIYNDEMEAIAFNRAGLKEVPVNSLKGYYGHTLGASGLLETVISIASARNNRLYKSAGFSEIGVSENINIVMQNSDANIKYFLKTASGFGGCNTAVIFEKI
jgi:3-oxoacyl-[acyl-carrier-protein] synthase-1